MIVVAVRMCREGEARSIARLTLSMASVVLLFMLLIILCEFHQQLINKAPITGILMQVRIWSNLSSN